MGKDKPGRLSSIADFLKLLKEIAVAITAVVGLLEPVTKWISSRVRAPWYAVSAALFLPTIGLGAYWWLRRRTKAASDPDVQSPPAPQPLPAPAPPPFFAYTSDDFEGFKWRWRWREGVGHIHPDFIEELAAFCPKCGLRIKPAARMAVETEGFGGGAGGRYSAGRQRWYCRLRCEEGCVDKEYPEHEIEVFTRIRHRIERNALKLVDG